MDHGNDDDRTIGEMRRRPAPAEPRVCDELVDDEPTVLGPVSPEDDIIARALASGKTQKEAGALVNRNERTVRRRMQNLAVRRLFEEYRWENRERFATTVHAEAPKAVETVTAELNSDIPSIRLRAAHELMNTAVRLSARPDSIDPGHDRARYGAALSNYIEACQDVLPYDVFQEVMSRISDLNAVTELLAQAKAPIMSLKVVIEKLDPAEAPKEYWEIDD
jgi:hypothetical protein